MDEKYHHTLRWRGHRRAIEEAERGRVGKIMASVIDDAELLAWRADPARARAFFRSSDAPTAIVAWNDHEAARLVVALTTAGIRVPDDVSVMGYDNLPEGQLVQPPLSTIDHSMDWQLRTALDLLRRPALPSPSHTMTVLPTLVPRGSTARVA
jgi:LacI family transcriptional regulator